MPKLEWDKTGTKEYEVGVSQGVLFTYNETSKKWEGTAWQGLTNVTESPDGGDAEDFYADNILYASIRGIESLTGSIECYMYPPVFEDCIGHHELVKGVRIGQQSRKVFGLAYVSNVGNDANPEAGVKYHLVYNCTANAAEMSHDTSEDSPNLEPFSFDFDSNPVPVTGAKATSSIVIDSRELTEAQKTALEKALFGGDNENDKSYLPYPDDLKTLITSAV